MAISSPRLFVFRVVAAGGEKRLGCYGSLPVCGRGSPVGCCLLAVLFLVAAPGCRRALVQAGTPFVRSGRR